MIEFIKDNAVWLTPLFVAVISGIFYLMKKGGISVRQTASDVHDSQVCQAGHDQTISK